MNIAILEDSKSELEQLTRYIQIYFSEHRIFRTVDIYSDGESFLANWKNKSYDLIFLDIMMGKITGIDVARQIRKTNTDCVIIFVSVSTEFALQGFEVRAFDYLVKPISQERFEHTMDLCHDELIKHVRCIEVKESRTIIKLPLQDIIYTDYYNHYIQIHTANRMIRSYQQFDTFAPLLLFYPQFLCCYRNCIVNMDYIANVDKNDFIMTTGERVPIIRANRHTIYQEYANYQFLKLSEKPD
ncbi:MAG: LytTR family DNA-binding domain-containing protein [Clostridium sp.]